MAKSTTKAAKKSDSPPRTNKMEAMRTALREMGLMAMPVAIQKFILDRFGYHMSTSHISNYKTEILRQIRRKKLTSNLNLIPTDGSHSKSSGESGSEPLAADQSAPTTHLGLSLSELKTVKDLVDRMGGDSLKSVIDLFEG